MKEKEPCTRCGVPVSKHFLVSFNNEDSGVNPYNPITKKMRLCSSCVEQMLEKLDQDDELKQISLMREDGRLEWEEIGLRMGDSAFNVKAKYNKYLDRVIEDLDSEVFGTIHALKKAKWSTADICDELRGTVPEDAITRIIRRSLWKKRGDSE